MSDDTIVDANDCKTSATTPTSETVELIINDFIDKIKRNEDVNNAKDKDKDNHNHNENDDEPLKIVESFEKTVESEESNISTSSNVGPKAKKSVTFNPNDEKIKKFITGEPIVDQRNPFKNAVIQREPKKTPPPVPTKRSTLSVRKTVTQQLREREREKEKEKEREREREQQKNETNARKVKKINGNGSVNGGTPDDFITTEEVLKQSKYVKTYIKNPDPYFVYDPTVLARLKYEEFQEKIPKPKRKQTQNSQPSKAQRLTKSQQQQQQQEATKLPFKKCSKPNYPELANIKIRTGTPINGDYFNPAEVTKNAKKFDERVKKLQISSDDDLDEIDGPLTKSESSDELTQHMNNNNNNNLNNHSNYSSSSNNDDSMNERNVQSQKMSNQSNGEPNEKLGTFTNTISSDEFQAYLERKGLALMPKRELVMSSPSSPSSTTTPTLTPSPLPYSNESPLVALRKSNSKKLSVLQRLSNSLFPTTRRKAIIMPKEMTTQPQPRAIYNGNKIEQGTPLEIRRRLLLEGQTKTTAAPQQQQQLQQQQQQQQLEHNQMTPIELRRRQPVEHSTKRSIPKATVPQKRMLYNAENDEIRRLLLERSNKLSSVPQQQQQQQQRTNYSTSDNEGRILLERSLNQQQQPNQMGRRSIAEGFQRNTLERQSLIPLPRRGISPDVSMNRFNRSASMDRNQIKVLSRQQQQQQAQPQPMATSTPVKEQQSQNDWEKLRAIKEVTDRQLYHKVLQQQQQQQQQQQHQQQQQQISEENIYEHLPAPTGYFIRGSAQRNTFSGIANTAAPAAAPNGAGHRNRQVMILDGTPIIHSAKQLQQQQQQQLQHIPARSQSVLDDMIPTRRGYESETEMPPVVMRRKDGNGNGNGTNGNATTNRRIGGLLTREEILEKVKEFCRKSINRTPSKMQPIYEKQQQQQQHHTHAEISPVSYASVERPLVPLRVQSLPQGQTPIYAHVNKRNSLLSNESEQYLSTQQLPQYVLVETEDGGIQAAKLLDYPNNSSIYNLQHQQQQQQQLQQFMRTSGGYIRSDGRTTPLILDRGNSSSSNNNAGQQQASQIYWTPQHQRLQQHYQQQSNLMTIPRYSAAAAATAANFDRGYPIPAPRLNTNGHIPYGHVVVPAPRKLLTQQQQRQLQLQQQQQQHQQPLAMRQFATSSDWECGSEAAGEIRRILEKPL